MKKQEIIQELKKGGACREVIAEIGRVLCAYGEVLPRGQVEDDLREGLQGVQAAVIRPHSRLGMTPEA